MRTGALDAANLTTLAAVHVQNQTITVTCDGASSTIKFIGQNGAVRQTVKDAVTSSYTFSDADTYVRTVIESPQTVLYLNPVVRYDGAALPRPAATVAPVATWLMRSAFAIGLAVLALLFTRPRSLDASKAAEPILPEATRKTA
jgi:hypothetical protein